MIQRIIYTILFFVISSNVMAHDFFMSVTRGNYNSETQMMECSMKVTAHDLENAIRIMYSKVFDLDDESQRKSHDQLIEKYISSRISIKTDNGFVNLEYVGYELEVNDDLWIYFQFKVPDQIFEYENKVLTEQFAMQQNVTHFKTDNCERSYVFTKNHSPEKFNCNE